MKQQFISKINFDNFNHSRQPSSLSTIQSSQISKFFPQTSKIRDENIKKSNEFNEKKTIETTTEKRTTKTPIKTDDEIEISVPAISKFFSSEPNESLIEFENPSKIRRKAAIKSSVKQRKPTKRNSKALKQPDIRNSIADKRKKNIQNLNEEEQIQLALALSTAEHDKQQGNELNFDKFEYKPVNGIFCKNILSLIISQVIQK